MIIGFTGYMGTGKTTAARYLVDKGWKLNSFKTSLVEEIEENFSGLLDEISNATKVPRHELFNTKPALLRKLMQEFGTNVRRYEDENYWISKWESRLDAPQVIALERVVVDDVRFENEAEIIRENGGIIVELQLEGDKRKFDHPSENEHKNIKPDFTIVSVIGKPTGILFGLDKVLKDISVD